MSKFRENILKNRRKKFTTTSIPIRYSSSTRPPYITSTSLPRTTTFSPTTTAFPATTTNSPMTTTSTRSPVTTTISPTMTSTSTPSSREGFEIMTSNAGHSMVSGWMILFLFLMGAFFIYHLVSGKSLLMKKQIPRRKKDIHNIKIKKYIKQ